MNQKITRQILWNIPVSFVAFLYLMLIPLTAAFVLVGVRWYRIVHHRRLPEAAGFFDLPYYLVATMEVL